MNTISRKAIIISILMIASSVAAVALKPTEIQKTDDVQLTDVVPQRFGEWEEDKTVAPTVVNPEAEELVRLIYAQTLTRTYVNRSGQRVMLSIAYGGNYGKGMAYHRPEICYPSQGFEIVSQQNIELPLDSDRVIPAKRLVARAKNRIEPITYWFVLGGKTTRYGMSMRLEQIRVGLTGVVPNGLLVRVSTIDPDTEAAFAVQEEFIKQMIAAIAPAHKDFLIGKSG